MATDGLARVCASPVLAQQSWPGRLQALLSMTCHTDDAQSHAAAPGAVYTLRGQGGRRTASNGPAPCSEEHQSARNHAWVGCGSSAGREARRRRLGVDLARCSVQLRQLRRSTAPVEPPMRHPTQRSCWLPTGGGCTSSAAPISNIRCIYGAAARPPVHAICRYTFHSSSRSLKV